MCIQQNYTHVPIVLYLNDDSNDIVNNIAYYDNNPNTPQNVIINQHDNLMNDYNPSYLPFICFEYLQLLDELHTRYKNNNVYNKLQYILGTMISIYGIYYVVARIVDSVYKKK